MQLSITAVNETSSLDSGTVPTYLDEWEPH